MNLLDPKILKDSSSNRLIEKLIRFEEARYILLGLATNRLGTPTETQKSLLNSLARSWDALIRECSAIPPRPTSEKSLLNRAF